MVELSGEQHINASRHQVWEALNNPDILKACIPGCESLEAHGENGFEATVTAKVGPVKARFTGNVELSNINAPESYTISGEGKGGAAGMVKGGADVLLEEDGDGTLLKYTVKANVAGKLASIGSRLIKSTAQKYADDFFSQFGDFATGTMSQAEGEPTSSEAIAHAAAKNPDGKGEGVAHRRGIYWALLAIVVGLLIYTLASK
jgi:uncharacterized protein